MWNNPRLLTLLANALFVLVALLAVATGVYALVRSPMFPLKVIRVEGELSKVGRAGIVEALQGHLQGTIFTVDLELVRARFETIPWVRRAEVRRAWPDRLEVRIEEHVELARWGRREDLRLVNLQGEIFNAASDRDLPVFAGPAGSEGEVARAYADFAKLLQPLGMEPRQVVLSERRAWQLKLDSGLVVQLGRNLAKDGVNERLLRFVQAYPRALEPMKRRLDYVDLRYPGGFALRVPGLQRIEDPKTSRPKA